MSNIERFEELLRSDEGLQARLRADTEAFEEDKSDERAYFDAVVAPLAAEAGLPFTYDEGKALAAEGVDLGDDALDTVAGGGCIVFGLAEGTDACSEQSIGATLAMALASASSRLATINRGWRRTRPVAIRSRAFWHAGFSLNGADDSLTSSAPFFWTPGARPLPTKCRPLVTEPQPPIATQRDPGHLDRGRGHVMPSFETREVTAPPP